MARIGFYGGSFNPPTIAHTGLALKAIEECNLDNVFFVPVNDMYKKEDLAQGCHRIKMLEIACKRDKRLHVSDIEFKYDYEFKAIDIFSKIKELYKDDEIFFLMGADNLERITLWKDSESLIENFKYIILDRKSSAENYINNNDVLKKNRGKFEIIENRFFNEYSSSLIREKLRNGEVPTEIDREVYNYIMTNKIY